MKTPDYREHIQNRQPFTSGMFLARTVGPLYAVFSYDELIGLWNPESGWIVNTQIYTQTTSKHQNHLAEALHNAGTKYKTVQGEFE